MDNDTLDKILCYDWVTGFRQLPKKIEGCSDEDVEKAIHELVDNKVIVKTKVIKAAMSDMHKSISQEEIEVYTIDSQKLREKYGKKLLGI